MAVNLNEMLGALHSGIKKGTIANTTSKIDSAAAGAGWIVANVYDTERTKGENRLPLIAAISQFAAHYKGDI